MSTEEKNIKHEKRLKDSLSDWMPVYWTQNTVVPLHWLIWHTLSNMKHTDKHRENKHTKIGQIKSEKKYAKWKRGENNTEKNKWF